MLRLTLSCVRTAAVTGEVQVGCRIEPCCGGRRGHVQQRRIRSGLHCEPTALSSTVHSRPSTNRSFGGASVQVSAGRSCCSKTRLVSCARTSSASLHKTGVRRRKFQCSVDKIPYLKLHCKFFSLSLGVFLYSRTVYDREKRKKVAEKSSDYADYKLLKSALSNQCSQVTINSNDSRIMQQRSRQSCTKFLIAKLFLVFVQVGFFDGKWELKIN